MISCTTSRAAQAASRFGATARACPELEPHLSMSNHWVGVLQPKHTSLAPLVGRGPGVRGPSPSEEIYPLLEVSLRRTCFLDSHQICLSHPSGKAHSCASSRRRPNTKCSAHPVQPASMPLVLRVFASAWGSLHQSDPLLNSHSSKSRQMFHPPANRLPMLKRL